MKLFVVNGKDGKRDENALLKNGFKRGWVIQVRIHPIILRDESGRKHNPPQEEGRMVRKSGNPSGDPVVGNNAVIIPFPGIVVSRQNKASGDTKEEREGK